MKLTLVSGLNCTIPKGTVAPGKVLPDRLFASNTPVPIKGFT
jgi:hypothetical protein